MDGKDRPRDGRRVAVVTGAAQGIGRAIAERLIRDGLIVELWDINEEGVERAARELGATGTARSAPVDVSDVEQVKAASERLVAGLGRVDVLVNNAGWDRFNWFLQSAEEDWDRTIGVCYWGVLATCRYLGPHIVTSEQGRIVNIASDTAKLGGPLEAVYSGAKAAVVSFSRALAREVAKTGATVNVVCPGATDTPLYRAIEREFATNPKFMEFFENGLTPAVLKQIPLGRLGKPEDVASAVSYLVSADAAFVTGQTLSVSGGQTMY